MLKFDVLAMILADVVLPVPGGPANSIAEGRSELLSPCCVSLVRFVSFSNVSGCFNGSINVS